MNDPTDRRASIGVRRTHTIKDLPLKVEEIEVTGRIVKLEETALMLTGVIRDETAEVAFETADRQISIALRDIVVLRGTGSRLKLHAEIVRVITPSLMPQSEEMPEPRLVKGRALVLQRIRDFFNHRGFMEVETPALTLAPDLTYAIQVFESEYSDDRGRRIPLFLHTSPETHMKRMLSWGYERIYQICKFFRNGEINSHHNPEFTGLEWYEAWQNYEGIMQTTENLICHLLSALQDDLLLRSGSGTLDLSPPWSRKPFYQLIRDYAGLDLEGIERAEELRDRIEAKGYHTNADDAPDDLLLRVFVNDVEPVLGLETPIFVTDYPVFMAAMAQPKPKEPHLAERFELYIGGLELCNGYSELNDPEVQLTRFSEERARKYGKRSVPLDAPFLKALAYGIPPAGGNALGIDRLLMLLFDARDIRNVRLFPLQSEIELSESC